jgi:hypothetical protein
MKEFLPQAEIEYAFIIEYQLNVRHSAKYSEVKGLYS